MERVVDKFIAELNGQLSAKRVVLGISAKTRTWLAQKGYDPRYGARPLVRLLQTEIKDILSEQILFGGLEKGGNVFVEIENGKPSFQY